MFAQMRVPPASHNGLEPLRLWAANYPLRVPSAPTLVHHQHPRAGPYRMTIREHNIDWDRSFWPAFRAVIRRLGKQGYFCNAWPDRCCDDHDFGWDESQMQITLQEYLPLVDWQRSVAPDAATLLSFIHFFYDHVAKPIGGWFHDYSACRQYHPEEFSVELGRQDFAAECNLLFTRFGAPLRLVDGQLQGGFASVAGLPQFPGQRTSSASSASGTTELRVFVGFQFKSPHIKRTEFEHAVVEAVQVAGADLDSDSARHATLTCDSLVLDSGRPLNQQIQSHIDQADICVFELSDGNGNVLFELGYALGRNKPCIYLMNEDVPVDQVPSDLAGLYQVRYRRDTLRAKLQFQVFRRAERLLESRSAESAAP